MNPKAARVLVVAGDPLVRAGLVSLLAEARDCQVVGRVGVEDLVAISEAVARDQPDVVIVDLGWSSEVIIAGMVELAALGAPILALAPDSELAAEASRAGALGVLPREAPMDILVAALGAVAQGLHVMHPDFTTIEVIGRVQAPLAEALTPREIEVLRLLAEGLTNKAIARRLGISDNTVKFHVNAILGKLGAASRTEATVIAARLGLIMV